MSPLTVLLVPPAGDTALIEGGVCRSRPPLMFRRHGPYSDDDRRLEMDRWSPLGDRASDVDCALVLVHEGTPVAMGCDRALRLAIPAHKARRDAVRAKIEDRARVIYATYPGADAHPWVEGGSSGRQYDARHEARREMSDDDLAHDASLGVIMGPAYAIEDALWIARFYADTHPGARVVLLRDGREVHDG